VYLNDRLPKHLRAKMNYPHLKSMLVSDPSEAVHSELFLGVHDRYFEPIVQRSIGGWLAYLVMTGNDALFDHLGPEADGWIEEVLRADEAAADTDPSQTLFSYVIGQPRRPGPSQQDRAEWAAVEDARELEAAENGGIYYPRTAVARALAASDPNGIAQLRPDQLVQTLPGKLLAEHLVKRLQPKRRAKDAWRTVSARFR
jgi:hypothetical protein